MRSETGIGVLRISSEKYCNDFFWFHQIGLEGVIGMVSFSLCCIKNGKLLLSPQREDFKVSKYAKVKEKWIAESNEIIHHAFLQPLDDIKLHILPGMTVDKYEFVIELDWSSGHCRYMIFGRCNQKEKLMKLGNHARGSFSSSYLGGLGSIV